jgi:hypothetical protein
VALAGLGLLLQLPTLLKDPEHDTQHTQMMMGKVSTYTWMMTMTMMMMMTMMMDDADDDDDDDDGR